MWVLLARYRVSLMSSSNPCWRRSTAQTMIWWFSQEQLCSPVAWIAFTTLVLKLAKGQRSGAYSQIFANSRPGRRLYQYPTFHASPTVLLLHIRVLFFFQGITLCCPAKILLILRSCELNAT
jgi:hypothetical protein